MRVFVTGASGSIGSAVVPALLDAGHEVLALARSTGSAAVLQAAGAAVLPGSLADHRALTRGAGSCDGVVHLAYDTDPATVASTAEWRAVEVLGSALEDTGKPLVVASGMLGLTPGWVATEHDGLALDPSWSPRAAAALATLGFAERGVRTALVRLPPAVHDATPAGLVGALAELARDRGVSGHPGDGAQRWPAVHRRDAARLFRLALENAPAGAVLHAVAEEGVPLRALAEALGAAERLPVTAVPGPAVAAHFGRLSTVARTDAPASSALTRELLGWQPAGPGLLDDVRSWSLGRVDA